MNSKLHHFKDLKITTRNKNIEDYFSNYKSLKDQELLGKIKEQLIENKEIKLLKGKNLDMAHFPININIHNLKINNYNLFDNFISPKNSSKFIQRFTPISAHFNERTQHSVFPLIPKKANSNIKVVGQENMKKIPLNLKGITKEGLVKSNSEVVLSSPKNSISTSGNILNKKNYFSNFKKVIIKPLSSNNPKVLGISKELESSLSNNEFLKEKIKADDVNKKIEMVNENNDSFFNEVEDLLTNVNKSLNKNNEHFLDIPKEISIDLDSDNKEKKNVEFNLFQNKIRPESSYGRIQMRKNHLLNSLKNTTVKNKNDIN